MTTQQTSVRQFILDRGLRMSVRKVDRNPHMDDGSATMDHWRCTIRTPPSLGKSLTVYFSMGSGHEGREPELADVLDCLASDSASIENNDTYEKWADEFGYDHDSRKAERTYKTCKRQAWRLESFLGRLAYEHLLWHTERL